MSKKSDARTALIEARVVREREWMHARWLERMTFRQIAAAASLPVEAGGLGIRVSPEGVRAMVTAHREASGDVTMGRDERRERQSDEVDMRARAARRDLEAAYRGLAEAEAIEPDPYDSPAERAAVMAGKAKLIEAWQATIERADRRLDAAQKREAELHGLAAPTKIEAEVTTRDGVLDDLNAALAAIGVDERVKS